jgi:hypothetical protein
MPLQTSQTVSEKPRDRVSVDENKIPDERDDDWQRWKREAVQIQDSGVAGVQGNQEHGALQKRSLAEHDTKTTYCIVVIFIRFPQHGKTCQDIQGLGGVLNLRCRNLPLRWCQRVPPGRVRLDLWGVLSLARATREAPAQVGRSSA